jgi:hypothetical protein
MFSSMMSMPLKGNCLLNSSLAEAMIGAKGVSVYVEPSGNTLHSLAARGTAAFLRRAA